MERCWDAWLLLGLLAFLLGFFSLSEPLSVVARDAARLEAIDPTATHWVDASVESRERGPYGDRIGLGSLRSVLTGEELIGRAELRVTRSEEPEQASRAERLLWPGASVRVGMRLSRAFSTRNPGSPDWDQQRARSGLVARARLVDPDWVVEHFRTQAGLHEIRTELENRRRLWQESRAKAMTGLSAGQGLARALVLGDRSGLTEASRNAFRQTGLGHLLAVSGLHVGFVAGFAAWLSRRAIARLPNGQRLFSNPFGPAIWAGFVAASIYAWMTGAAISVVRASLLLGLFVLARQGRRKVKPIPALASIAAVLLWMNPASLFDLGARFSFTACFALAVSGLWGESTRLEIAEAAPRSESAAAKLLPTARASFAASLAVSFGTLPWVAQLQGPLHVLSPLLNLLAIPWTGLVVLPASMGGVLGVGVLPDIWVAGLLWPAALLAGAVEYFATSPPLLPLQIGIPFGGVWLCAVGGVLLVRRGALIAALLIWWGVAIIGVLPSVGSDFETSIPRAVFFDVGQGDATLIQSELSTWLIDSGPGPPDGSGGGSISRGLSALGVRYIDVLVVTHADLDHRGGAKRILEAYSVGALWLPETDREEPALQALAKLARARGTRVRRIRAGNTPEIEDPGMRVEVLWPRLGSSGTSRNESSLVMRFFFVKSERSILMTADVGHATERSLLEAPEQLRADILKVGHHGSRGSTSDAFLKAVSPSWAILSAPCEPTRGLPSQTVIERLRASGGRLAWTGRDGALSVGFGAAYPESEGQNGIQVEPWAARRGCPGELVAKGRKS